MSDVYRFLIFCEHCDDQFDMEHNDLVTHLGDGYHAFNTTREHNDNG
jgi:hypothetical protein